MTLTIPDWCRIGATVEYEYRPGEWVDEVVHSYGTDGFFHQAYGCPMYYSKYSEFGRTIRLIGQQAPAPDPAKIVEKREEYRKWAYMFRKKPEEYYELRVMQGALWFACTQMCSEYRERVVIELKTRIVQKVDSLAGRYEIGNIAAEEIARHFCRPVPFLDGMAPGTIDEARKLMKEVWREIEEEV